MTCNEVRVSESVLHCHLQAIHCRASLPTEDTPGSGLECKQGFPSILKPPALRSDLRN